MNLVNMTTSPQPISYSHFHSLLILRYNEVLPQVKDCFDDLDLNIDLDLNMFPDKNPIINIETKSETEDKGVVDLIGDLDGENTRSGEVLSPDAIRSSWHKSSFNKLSKKEKIKDNLTENFSLLVNPKHAFKGHNEMGLVYVPMNTGQLELKYVQNKHDLTKVKIYKEQVYGIARHTHPEYKTFPKSMKKLAEHVGEKKPLLYDHYPISLLECPQVMSLHGVPSAINDRRV